MTMQPRGASFIDTQVIRFATLRRNATFHRGSSPALYAGALQGRQVSVASAIAKDVARFPPAEFEALHDGTRKSQATEVGLN